MKLHSLALLASLTILLSNCGSSGTKNSASETPIVGSSSSSVASSIASSSSTAQTSSSVASSAASSSVASSSAAAVTPCTTQECEAKNKESVLKIYTDIMNKGQVDLIETLFDSKVVLHIPGTNNGSTGETAHLQGLKNNNPAYVATVKHIGADGDYVAVHWHLSATPANEFNGKAAIDLYKFSGNKIVDHWFLTENLSATTVSSNSLFSNLYIYASPKPAATQASEAANKDLVTMVYLGLFNDKNLALVDQYIAPDYIQHNPYVPNGREAFRSFVTSRTPGGLSFFATVADDDLVWTFGGNSSLTLLDIFRVDNKKIVEHYDIF